MAIGVGAFNVNFSKVLLENKVLHLLRFTQSMDSTLEKFES
jgi:hypothetical protein